jgi:hypothetical protein
MGTTSGGYTKIKQVLSSSNPNLEHFRYTKPHQGAWDEWNRAAAHPKKEHNQLTHLVGIGSEYVMGGNRTSYQEAEPAITYYTDKHYVSYDKTTSLNATQKQLARDNIGAPTLGANIPDGALLIYNAQTKQITDSGFTIKTFYDKILADIKTWIATEEIIEDNEAGGQTAMYSAPPESVASVANEQGGDTLMIGGIE